MVIQGRSGGVSGAETRLVKNGHELVNAGVGSEISRENKMHVKLYGTS